MTRRTLLSMLAAHPVLAGILGPTNVALWSAVNLSGTSGEWPMGENTGVTLADTSGNGNNLTATGLTWAANGAGLPAASTAPVIAATPWTGWLTMHMAFRLNSGSFKTQGVCSGGASALIVDITRQGRLRIYQSGGSTFSVTQDKYPYGHHVLSIVLGASPTVDAIYIDGVLQTLNVSGFGSTATKGASPVFWNAAGNHLSGVAGTPPCEVEYLVFYSSALSAAQVQSNTNIIRQKLLTRNGKTIVIPGVSANWQYLVAGNSLSDLIGATAWGFTAAPLVLAQRSADMYSQAVSGQSSEDQNVTATTAYSNAASTTALGGIDLGVYNPNAGRIILTMWEGGNSLVKGDSVAQAMAALNTFFANRLAAMVAQGVNLANVVLYCGTVTPRDPASAFYTGNFTLANALALNVLIRASVGAPIAYSGGTYTPGYKLWDIAALATSYGQAATYAGFPNSVSADGTHFTAAGYAAIAQNTAASTAPFDCLGWYPTLLANGDI